MLEHVHSGGPAISRPITTVAVGLLAGSLAGAVATSVVVAPAAAGGADGVTPATQLLGTLAFAAGLLIVVVLLLRRRSETVTVSNLGVRSTPVPRAVRWTVLATGIVGAFALVWSLAVDLGDLPVVPTELDGRSGLAERFELGEPAGRVDVGLGALASALARVVVCGLLAEIVLRGFALPALVRGIGELPALGVTALLTVAPLSFALGGADGWAMVPPAAVLGTALGLLALATRSVLPGAALAGGAYGVCFAQAAGWSAPGTAAVACAGAALTLALATAVARRG